MKGQQTTNQDMFVFNVIKYKLLFPFQRKSIAEKKNVSRIYKIVIIIIDSNFYAVVTCYYVMY